MQKVGNAEVTFKQVHERAMTVNNKKQPYYDYEFEYKGIEPNGLKFVAHDAEGNLIGLPGGGGGSFGNQGSFMVTAYKKPATMTAKVLSEMKPVEYGFKLENVLLAADPKKPEKIEPATFPGHKVPVTLEFMKSAAQGNITKIQVRAVNHSDKDIHMLEMKFVYLDGSGKKLDEFAHVNYTPPPMFPQKEVPLVVAKNSTATFEVHAFFMPPGTKKVDITVSRVGFADATEWRPGAGPEK